MDTQQVNILVLELALRKWFYYQEDGSPDNVDYLETWQGMEDAKALGLARSIGVSNFNIEQLQRLFANSRTRPVVNEVEVGMDNMVGSFCTGHLKDL